MKLKIVKDKGSLTVEVATDTAKKPITMTLTPSQVESVIAILRNALATDKMTLELEI